MMKIYIDYKLLYRVEGTEGGRCKIPHKDRIEKLNKLLDSGDEIHIWIEDNIAFLHEVVASLKSWGCRFMYVKLGKPEYDMIIDDKSTKAESFFS